VSHFPTSENGIFESEEIKNFKEEKIFELASERSVVIETVALKTRTKEISGFWCTQKKDQSNKYS
jgi:hypothetical protein